ncbi:class IV adenylate cyclase [Nocardia sp. NBC_00511]|uniref:class IV adenylate cyclase n=1 Tax=Nocardia sp. NBC_00511 TaxID=2903591 RepID=UPI0030E446E2
MIEAEYKARLADPIGVRERLDELAEREVVSYFDTYFDLPDRSLGAQGRELRVRSVVGTEGSTHVLTFKDAAVDAATGSKPEYETVVAERDSTEAIVRGLGYVPVISFTKRCENYRFTAVNREIVASLVTVPEIEGVFLELETLAPPDDLNRALAALREVLSGLGVGADQFTTELYTDAVSRSRG